MLYELIVRQIYQQQECINRFHYLMGGTPAAVSGSFALTFAFGLVPTSGVYPATAPFTLMRALQSVDLQYRDAEARAMYNDADFYTRPFVTPIAGTVGGEAASPALAYGFQSNRVLQSIRRGHKRFAGVSEAGMGSGGVIVAPVLAAANAMATGLGEVLTYNDEGNTVTFTPVVLSFERYTTPSGRVAYRQYATLSEQLDRAAVGVLYSPMSRVRTQVSRQYGRGS